MIKRGTMEDAINSAEERAAEWANKQREKLQKRVTKSSWWMRIKKFFSDFSKSM